MPILNLLLILLVILIVVSAVWWLFTAGVLPMVKEPLRPMVLAVFALILIVLLLGIVFGGINVPVLRIG